MIVNLLICLILMFVVHLLIKFQKINTLNLKTSDNLHKITKKHCEKLQIHDDEIKITSKRLDNLEEKMYKK